MIADVNLNAPFAGLFGCKVVSVAQSYSGKWLVVVWAPQRGPAVVASFRDYFYAMQRARDEVSETPGAVLDLPRAISRMHVLSNECGYEVMHEGSSGENFASLGVFGHEQYGEAVGFAKSQLGQYAPCMMGEVCSCHF